MKRIVTSIVSATAAFGMVFALSACSALNLSSTYTPEELEASISYPTIAEDGVLRVGVNSSNAPFSAQVSGSIVGIDVDVAAALAEELGLSLEIVDVGSDAEGALEEGTVDIIMNVDSTDSTVACWTSEYYLESSVALFSMDGSAELPYVAETETDPVIEVQTSSLSAWEVTSQYGDEAATSVDDLATAFSDLEAGSADYVAADVIIGSYVAHSDSIDAQIIGLMETVSGYSIGVSSDNTDLQTAVSEALSNLSSQGIIDVIELKWLGADIDVESYPLTENATDTSVDDVSADDDDDDTSEVGSNAVTDY